MTSEVPPEIPPGIVRTYYIHMWSAPDPGDCECGKSKRYHDYTDRDGYGQIVRCVVPPRQKKKAAA